MIEILVLLSPVLLEMRRRSNTNSARMSTGSRSQIPSDLNAQIQHLEEQLTVSTEKLKEITEYFVSELERGLSAQDGDHIVRTVEAARGLHTDFHSLWFRHGVWLILRGMNKEHFLP